jgi:hypothetical protein
MPARDGKHLFRFLHGLQAKATQLACEDIIRAQGNQTKAVLSESNLKARGFFLLPLQLRLLGPEPRRFNSQVAVANNAAREARRPGSASGGRAPSGASGGCHDVGCHDVCGAEQEANACVGNDALGRVEVNQSTTAAVQLGP